MQSHSVLRALLTYSCFSLSPLLLLAVSFPPPIKQLHINIDSCKTVGCRYVRSATPTLNRPILEDPFRPGAKNRGGNSVFVLGTRRPQWQAHRRQALYKVTADIDGRSLQGSSLSLQGSSRSSRSLQGSSRSLQGSSRSGFSGAYTAACSPYREGVGSVDLRACRGCPASIFGGFSESPWNGGGAPQRPW
jgi:hypothetical protein